MAPEQVYGENMAVGDPNKRDESGESFGPGRTGDDQVYRITSAPESAKLERQARTRRYLISMGIRTLCFIGAILTNGPLRWVLVVCAIGLPYIAVVLANSPVRRSEADDLPPFVVNQTAQLTDADSFLKACDDATKRAD